jgi:enoyl reductase-like protein
VILCSNYFQAKLAIVRASGVSDDAWENTYTKPTGGIISVLSEMGEPIHKLATRGVLFWYGLLILAKTKLIELGLRWIGRSSVWIRSAGLSS